MTLADYSLEELLAEVQRRQKVESMARRKQRDHDRYMRNREERIAYQKAYYDRNKESVKQSVRRSEKRRIEKLKHGANFGSGANANL